MVRGPLGVVEVLAVDTNVIDVGSTALTRYMYMVVTGGHKTAST